MAEPDPLLEAAPCLHMSWVLGHWETGAASEVDGDAAVQLRETNFVQQGTVYISSSLQANIVQ